MFKLTSKPPRELHPNLHHMSGDFCCSQWNLTILKSNACLCGLVGALGCCDLSWLCVPDKLWEIIHWINENTANKIIWHKRKFRRYILQLENIENIILFIFVSCFKKIALKLLAATKVTLSWHEYCRTSTSLCLFLRLGHIINELLTFVLYRTC